jgi:hypothetical protein
MQWLILILLLVGGFSIYLLFTQPQNFLYYAEIFFRAIFIVISFLARIIIKFIVVIFNFIKSLFGRRT